jgi:short subunit dehydrogenase-like uncharacterized protein
MARTLLLYGATGYSGRLIADELGQLRAAAPGAWRIVLAGRDEERLAVLAQSLGAEFRAFGLQDDGALLRALAESDADVVINAAGPFAWTAPVLADAAIAGGCDYVDINGEADVYRKLDDRDWRARQRGVALVGSAGFWAAASNLLLDRALRRLAGDPKLELGAIRIAMSRIRTFSRGSAQTVWRSLREQVTVVRKGRSWPDADADRMVLWHEPVGKLERSFDFGVPGNADRRIASAASLVDTLAARRTLEARGRTAEAIESYLEAGLAGRIGYQLGAWLAPLAAIPALRAVAQQPLALLAPGPTERERGDEPHVVLLQIEDSRRSPIVDWCWETPNVYQFTAQLAVAVAAGLRGGGAQRGWLTPAQVLAPTDFEAPDAAGPLRGTQLHARTG